VEPTPLEQAPASLAGDRDVWLKREDVHELGAFKWRGALPTLGEWRTDVVTASTGNHGAATAWAARQLGVRATVFVPEQASATKLALIRRWDADLRQVGADFDDAKDAARAFAEERGLPFFEDGAEPAQYEGYAAIGREITAELDQATVVVPVGNGALLIGTARGLAADMRTVGVVAAAAPVMADSWRAGRVVDAPYEESIADGLAVRVAIPSAVDELCAAADEMVAVSELELMRGVAAYHRAGIRAEAAAAAALAALPQLEANGPIVLIVTGRNIDDDLLARCLAAA
jgi:threonine dehydratase